MNAALKSGLIGTLRVAVSVVLVGLIVWKVGAEELVVRLIKIDPLWVVSSSIFFVVTGVLHAWRWERVLRSVGYGWTFPAALKEIWIGYFFNQILPTSAGGDGVRVLRLFRAKVPMGPAFRSVFVERVFAAIACAILGVPAVAALLWVAPGEPATTVVGFVEAGGLLAILLLFKPSVWLAGVLPAPLAKEYQILSKALVDPRYALGSLGISLVMQATTALSIVSLAMGVDAHSNPLLIAILVPPIILLAMIPASFAGWGLREGVMIAVLGAVRVNSADALLLSLLFGAVGVVASLPGALALASHWRGNAPSPIQ